MELHHFITLLSVLQVHRALSHCVTKEEGSLVCVDVDIEEMVRLLNNTHKSIYLDDCSFPSDVLDPRSFANATNLRELTLFDCDIEEILPYGNRSTAFAINSHLRTVRLRSNDIEVFHSTMQRLMQWWPSVIDVDLSGNYLGDVEEEDVTSAEYIQLTQSILSLNLSNSRLSIVPQLPPNVITLHIQQNDITHIGNISLLTNNLRYVNMSFNDISRVDEAALRWNSRLQSLDLSHNLLAELPAHPPTSLQYMDISHNALSSANLSNYGRRSRDLRHFDLSNNRELAVVFGSLADFSGRLTFLSLASCHLSSLPVDFLLPLADRQHLSVNLTTNPFWCGCQTQWMSKSVPSKDHLLIDVNATCISIDEHDYVTQLADEVERGVLGDMTDLSISCPRYGSSLANSTTVRYYHDSDAYIDCHTFGTNLVIDWHRLHPRQHIGTWFDQSASSVILANRSDGDAVYEIVAGGRLLLRNFDRADVETYTCVVRESTEASPIVVRNIQVRQDVTLWVEHVEVYSIVCAVITCACAFTAHMIWSCLRRIMMWRIDRAERTNRVRNMLEAMEKYRAKQMEQAYTAYSTKTTIIRDNYHQQVEQLWHSYMSQANKIKDYKMAQIDAMSEHWGNIRENYNSQVVRMREYGRGQMERIAENYERQMNKIRTFSLEQRLKLARQYHFKQQYMNKLVESMHVDWPIWTAADNTLDDPPNVPTDILGVMPVDRDFDSISSYHSMESLPELGNLAPLLDDPDSQGETSGNRNSNRSSVHSDFIASISDSETVV